MKKFKSSENKVTGENKQAYEVPSIEVITVSVEKGFANSPPGNPDV